MKIIEVSFRVYDDEAGKSPELAIRHKMILFKVAKSNVPFSMMVASHASKFWESIVLMGTLEK
jgi:hypothetical protein